MTKFHFILDVKLPPGSPDPMTYLDALREGGCDDATIGIGKRSLRLHISRDGTDLYRVIAQAEASVRRTIPDARIRSEEQTSELQSLMRISYAVFCLKKKQNNTQM